MSYYHKIAVICFRMKPTDALMPSLIWTMRKVVWSERIRYSYLQYQIDTIHCLFLSWRTGMHKKYLVNKGVSSEIGCLSWLVGVCIASRIWSFVEFTQRLWTSLRFSKITHLPRGNHPAFPPSLSTLQSSYINALFPNHYYPFCMGWCHHNPPMVLKLHPRGTSRPGG